MVIYTYRCIHVEGVTNLLEEGKLIITLRQLGSQTVVIFCEDCYKEMISGEKVKIRYGLRRFRYATLAKQASDNLFPEILIDLE